VTVRNKQRIEIKNKIEWNPDTRANDEFMA
jgi:hypothetical protein